MAVIERKNGTGIKNSVHLNTQNRIQVQFRRYGAKRAKGIDGYHSKLEIERLDVGEQKVIGLINCSDFCQGEFDGKTTLQRVPQALYPSFGLRGPGGNQRDAQFAHRPSKLGIVNHLTAELVFEG